MIRGKMVVTVDITDADSSDLGEVERCLNGMLTDLDPTPSRLGRELLTENHNVKVRSQVRVRAYPEVQLPLPLGWPVTVPDEEKCERPG